MQKQFTEKAKKALTLASKAAARLQSCNYQLIYIEFR